MSINTKFINRLQHYQDQKEKQIKRFNRTSNIRMLVFLIGAGVTGFSFLKAESLYGYSALFLSLLLFGYFVFKHQKIRRELNKLICKIKINEKYLSRMDGSWIDFTDNGQEFIDPNHPYTSDLDVFGAKSLFQWMNVTYTFHGRKQLRDLLAAPEKNIPLIKKRQNSVTEMAQKDKFVEELQCIGMLTAEVKNDPDTLIAYAEESSPSYTKLLQIIFYIVPAATILTMVLFFNGFSISIYVPLILIIIQMVITAIGFSKNALTLYTVFQFKEKIKAFHHFIQLIEQENFQNGHLMHLQTELYHAEKSASLQIKQLERIVAASELRYNFISFCLMNFLLLWDFHCVFALEAWKKENGKMIRKWFRIIGEFEAIASLGVILQIHPQWAFPDFVEQNLAFSATDIGHPLLVEDKSVRNNIEIKNNLCVITGSNMSGKTTLLRTIGINLILAYCGAPVCATKLECSIMNIFTSMRISDDLNSGISTFYAELLRIKMIIDFSHKKQDMIFLIDEIFRGTNSIDRLVGATSVLKNLNKSWVIGLISTHDFELCNLEDEAGNKIMNYHFTESYVNNEIQFDYKLRSGRCTTTNAKYLMRMVGIELYDSK
ncbi:MutS family DNA mismatch repair protein [Pelosinus fermentans]|uniref:DNA mismatch repair protein MutS domain protein n=1 Tax=Pelosinus fermentans JBW45 TaxID=1192197 RepID=I9DG95_9FIRM|nr:MutS family DNA mismatch repair protein [Pelosinus fermentans]AJQ26667.1 DNA mismatch repair protein MutS domain protein [Pelosinus fermentans JBW45]